MNELQVFNNSEFGQLRTVTINGEPWLVGKDVAAALGYSDTFGALKKHVDEEDKQNCQNDSFESNRGMTVINESGLYSLVLSSKLPTAKKFRRWVTSEVIPSIRKHGAYITPDTIDKMIATPEFGIKLLTALKDEQEKNRALEAENALQKQAIADFEPIKQYVDTILESKGTLATTQIAADYGMSAQQLNRVLKEEGIQWNVNGQWILRKKYMGMGLTSSKTIQFTHADGRPDTRVQTVWTQKGRLKIHEILTARGITAVMDRDYSFS